MSVEITLTEQTEIKRCKKLIKINNLRLEESCLERYLQLYERKRAGFKDAPGYVQYRKRKRKKPNQ